MDLQMCRTGGTLSMGGPMLNPSRDRENTAGSPAHSAVTPDGANRAPHTAGSSGFEQGSLNDRAEFAPDMGSGDSSLERSILDFGEARGMQVRRSGLSLPSEMTFDSWRELGSRVIHIANCSAWWLGDWIVYGEQSYGDRYEQAITDTSLRYQTLRNYAWVARRFPMSRRRDTLSFGHHAEVAGLPDDEQDMWL